ncbi:hypothetical protein ACT3S2_02585 [Arthrobacter sp. AOP36-A1-22]|uniref:hypothetical protein n=1 Tax=Arthrobacter sp. AOP36-A1-22 TaxID=3457684 RepID=UPI00403328B3
MVDILPLGIRNQHPSGTHRTSQDHKRGGQESTDASGPEGNEIASPTGRGLYQMRGEQEPRNRKKDIHPDEGTVNLVGQSW